MIVRSFWNSFSFLNCFYKHCIEGTNLNCCMSNGYYRTIHLDNVDIELFLMLQRRSKPTFAAFAIIEARFTVAQSVSACTTVHTAVIVMFLLILQCIILSRYIFVRFAFHADADIVVTYIFADFDGLGVCFAVIQQLDGKRVMLNDFCLSVFQESAYLAETEGRH